MTPLTVALAPRRLLRAAGLLRRPSQPQAPAAVGIRPLRARGEPLRQVDATTCGSAVLVVLRAAVDPEYRSDVGGRCADAQRAVQRQSRRCWPRALGTTPWGMARWLRRNTAGRYQVRLVDVADPVDLDNALVAVDATTEAGWPVPLLVGSLAPRHWCLALSGSTGGGWLVYNPSTGRVHHVPRKAVRDRRLGSLLGFDDLQAVLLPVPAPKPGQRRASKWERCNPRSPRRWSVR